MVGKPGVSREELSWRDYLDGARDYKHPTGKWRRNGKSMTETDKKRVTHQDVDRIGKGAFFEGRESIGRVMIRNNDGKVICSSKYCINSYCLYYMCKIENSLVLYFAACHCVRRGNEMSYYRPDRTAPLIPLCTKCGSKHVFLVGLQSLQCHGITYENMVVNRMSKTEHTTLHQLKAAFQHHGLKHLCPKGKRHHTHSSDEIVYTFSNLNIPLYRNTEKAYWIDRSWRVFYFR